MDGLTHDGLTDVYNKFHMGNCGENTANKLDISRQEQDEYGETLFTSNKIQESDFVLTKLPKFIDLPAII